MPARLVEVNVEADERIERLEGARDARAVRHRQHRVAADDDHRAHLAGPRRLDLLGHAGRGELAEHLGCLRDARAAPAGREAASGAAQRLRVGRECGRLREHRSARPIEVAGQHVEELDQPARERAESLRARADASVDGGARRGRELARQAADRRGGQGGRRRHALGRERPHGKDRVLEASHVLGEATRPDEVLLDQRGRHAEQQEHVGTWPQELVFVGEFRRLGAAGIDDDKAAATAPERACPSAKVRDGPQAAVGGRRVGTEHQQVVGAIDVRHRNGHGGTEQESGDQLLGHLVER